MKLWELIENAGLGPGGNCICAECGYKTPHKRGEPCNEKTCPKCGNKMERES